MLCWSSFALGALLCTASSHAIFADIENDNSYIRGGEGTNILKHPWMGSLQVKIKGYWTHVCGCVLYKENFLLTSGHCVETYWGEDPNSGLNELRVILGTVNITDGFCAVNPDCQNLTVVSAKLHEAYKRNPVFGKSNVKNIALLEVSPSADVSGDVVNIIKIHDRAVKPNQPCNVTGWGVTTRGGSTQLELMNAAVYILQTKLCAPFYRIFSKKNNVYPTQFCTTSVMRDKATCYGDSGGPVTTTTGFGRHAKEELIGIISASHATCNGCYPSVHIRLKNPSIKNFIERNT